MLSLGIDIGGSSVKAAAIRDGVVVGTGRSPMYHRPSRAELLLAIRTAVEPLMQGVTHVGVCLPGVFDRDRRAVVLSVNLPSIVDERIDMLISDALHPVLNPIVASDTHATAHDLYTSRNLAGRLFVLTLGTGIGAAVLDTNAILLQVDGDSPGHFGQLDVSLAGEPVVGPDGGSGSLEGYLGAAALRGRYGDHFFDQLASLSIADPPLQALIRAIRIAHAIHRPQHVILAGGIGIQLRPLALALYRAVSDQLTQIARAGWTLDTGDTDFHAAIGAAKLAIRSAPH